MKPRAVPPPALLAGAPLCLALLAWNAYRHLPFMPDDTFISLRYARRLVEGAGLTWDSYRPVEGYSNFLWTVTLAGAGYLGFDLVTAARVLGFLATAAALASAFAVRPCGAAGRAPPALLPGLFFVTCGLTGAWAVGGLEQPLLAALLAWGIVTLYPVVDGGPASLLPGLFYAGVVLSRPDGVVFVAAAAAAVVLSPARRPDDAGRKALAATLLLVPPVLAGAGLLGFRLWYYGEWVPNTAYAKLAGSLHHMAYGLRYVTRGFGVLFPFLVLAGFLLPAALRDPAARPRALLLGLTLAAWTSYLVVIGGDVDPPSRHFVPVTVLLLLAATEARSRAADGRAVRDFRTAAVCLLLFQFVIDAADVEARDARAYGKPWRGYHAVCDTLLKAFGRHDPLMAVDAAGFLPYCTRFASLDMLGLNDHHVARHPPAGFGSGWIGHELGDADYVLARKPDIVLFHDYFGDFAAHFPSDAQLLARTEFTEAYAKAEFESPSPDGPVRTKLWIRKEGRVGVVASERVVEVPVYLFTGLSGPVRIVDGAPAATAGASAEAPAVGLSPGRWKASLRLPGGNTTPSWEFEAPARDDGRGAVAVSPGGEPGPVTRLVLEKIG